MERSGEEREETAHEMESSLCGPGPRTVHHPHQSCSSKTHLGPNSASSPGSTSDSQLAWSVDLSRACSAHCWGVMVLIS